MPKQGRVGDKSKAVDTHGKPCCSHTVEGPAVQGSPNVFVNSQAALRVGDPGVHAACCGPNTWQATKGSKSVFINGIPAHRLDDDTVHCGGLGHLIEGSSNVLVGDSGDGGEASNEEKCSTGEPIDISTGKVFSTVTDVVFSRPLALAIVRTYDSSRVDRTGLFGVGWFSLFDVYFRFTPHRILLQDIEGRILSFPLLAVGQSHTDPSEKLTLLRQEDSLQLTTEHQITYAFRLSEEHWRLSRITDEKNNVITLIYEGQQLSVKDAKNHLYRFVYDQNERLITAVYRDPLQTPLRRYHYDEFHRLVSVEDELSTPVSYRYDAQHRLIEHSKPNGYIFYYQYDDSGRCVKNWGSDGAHTRELKHFPAEQKTEVIDSRGNKTVYDYDNAGLTTAVTNPDGTTRHYTYDAYRQLILEVDENQAVTRYEYNPAGKLITRIDANQQKWEMRHEADAITQIDPLGNQVTQTKQGEEGFVRADQQGNRQEFKLPDYVKQRHYDDWQRLTAVEDKLGHKTQFEYDVKGNLVGIIDKKGQRTAFGYDQGDHLVWTQDPLGYQRRFVYRGFDNKIAQYDENHSVVQFDYDTEGNLTTLTNENGVPHHFTYDHSDRVVASQGFDGHTTRYAYDAVSNVTEVRHADGSELTLTYDKVGRLRAIRGTDEHGLTCHQQYHYDAAGQLMTAENEYATVRFEYDGLGRLVKEYQNNQVVERRYDDKGHYVARRSPWGTEIRFAYDANAQLIEMGLTAEKVIGYRLDAMGRPLNRFLPGGTHADYTYDEIGNLLSQTIQNHNRLFIQRHYEYDARHKLSRLQDSSRLEKRFAYDPAGRLHQVSYSNNLLEQFAYDPAGNLLHQEARYDRGNRLLRFNGYAYEYDTRGNLIRKTSAAGTVEYRYNIFNQLIAAQTPRHGWVEFQYDALGRRILKKSQHREVRYYWNQLELFGEVGADEPIEYVFHHFAPVATLQKGQIYYYHNDHLGTPLEMTDERGRLVWRGEYATLGRCRGQGEVVNRLRFPGQWEDEETGLHFNVFRYYDAEVGRYVTKDPIGYGGGDWNLYRYVRNDILNYIDSHGLEPLGTIGSCGLAAVACTVGEVGTMGADTLVCIFSVMTCIGSLVPTNSINNVNIGGSQQIDGKQTISGDGGSINNINIFGKQTIKGNQTINTSQNPRVRCKSYDPTTKKGYDCEMY